MTLKIITKSLICLFFLTSAYISSAQSKVDITGQVKDAQSKDILEFCTVSVYNATDSLIAGAITDDKGFFNIPVNPGAYHIIFSFMGYKNDTTSNIKVMQNTFLGVFKLEPDVKMLNEFTVKTSSRENLIDRDIQVVTDKMKEGTANTKEVLDKIPGVDYDRYSNAIKVDNDAKVIILVDGLEKDQEYIKNLSPDRLKKIEIIRDPGGRYALEGYSAVINVILKKNYQGVELYLSDESMFDTDTKNKKKVLIINSGSGTLNYTYNKFNIYSKFGSYFSDFDLPSSSRKEYDYGLIIENNPPSNNLLNTKVKQLTNNYTFGADYYINPKHTVSFESNLSGQPAKQNITDVLLDNKYFNNETLISNFSSESKSVSGSNSSYNSLFYQGILDENNTINSNFTFSNYTYDYTNEYLESSLYHRLENGINKKNGTKFYMEYFHTFSPKTNIQLGYGNTWESQHNNFTIDTIRSAFEYSNMRHKLYSYFAWQVGKKTGIKIGGAGETSAPKTSVQKNSYLIFLPYADLKYDMSQMLNLKLKYRAASNYPSMDQTNPFTYTIDQQSIKTGNPNLRPEVTHKISLQANILGGLASIEPYFHFSNNYITETGVLKNDSIFEYGYSNMGKYKNYGVQTNITIPFGKSIFLQTTLNLYNSSITYNNKTNNLKDFTLSEQLIYTKEKTGLLVGLQYQKNLQKYITAQGYNKGDNDFWIAFIQQPFFKQKLNIMLIYFLPISWGVSFDQGSYIKTDNYIETRSNDISFLKNIVMLQASYRFNKGKNINKTEKNIEQENNNKKKFL